MQYTTNFNLKEPQYADEADVAILNDNFEDIDGIMHQNRLMLAEPFDQTKAYSAGKMVVYEGASYKFKVDHAAGNWNSSQVEQMPIADGASGGGVVTKTVTGNPIEITDAASAPMVRCETAITGSQDLHGYDKPWVGGAGKNKLPLTVAGIKAANSGATWTNNATKINGTTFTILTDDGGNVTGIKAEGTPSSNAGLILYGSTTTSADDITVSNDVILSIGISGSSSTVRGVIWKSSGNGSYDTDVTISAPDTIYGCGIRVIAGYNVPTGGVIFYPMLRLATVQDATFEPYSNICPITAYTEGKIEVSGKNLFSDKLYKDNYGINSSGSEYSSSSYYIAVENLSPSENYVISATYIGTSQAQSLRVQYYDSADNVLSMDSVTLLVGARTSLAFTTPATTAYAHISINKQNTDIQIESGSTATDYEPYTSTPHTTTYPSAIYRGSEDVVNGTETHDMVVIDLSTIPWEKETWGSGVDFYSRAFTSIIKSPPDNDTPANIVCSDYENVSRNTIYASTNPCASVLPGGIFKIRDSRYDKYTKEDFKTAMSGVQLAYELATPTTSSVTPTNLPIKSLSGYNHIESTTGDMEVEYITEGYQPLIDLAEGGEEGETLHVYSTEEKQVGVWTDGTTPVYEITVSPSDLSASYAYVPLGVTDRRIMPIEVHGSGLNWANGQVYILGTNYTPSSGYTFGIGTFDWVWQAGDTYLNQLTICKGASIPTVSSINITVRYIKL